MMIRFAPNFYPPPSSPVTRQRTTRERVRRSESPERRAFQPPTSGVQASSANSSNLSMHPAAAIMAAAAHPHHPMVLDMDQVGNRDNLPFSFLWKM